MRRYSKRNALVTLSDINLTPLMDLSFVLLIIFVITAPLLEQGLNLNLPVGGRQDQQLDPRDVRTVEISPRGQFALGGQLMPLPQLEQQLVSTYQQNPNLAVYIRADRRTPFQFVFAVTDMLAGNGIRRVSLRAEPQNP